MEGRRREKKKTFRALMRRRLHGKAVAGVGIVPVGHRRRLVGGGRRRKKTLDNALSLSLVTAYSESQVTLGGTERCNMGG